MICPSCRSQAEVIDSRQLTEWRYRRYRCVECRTRFTTGEFVVAIGNRAGGQPVERWLEKVRAQGAAMMKTQIAQLLRAHLPGDWDGTEEHRRIPQGIQTHAVEKPHQRVALASEGEQRPDGGGIE